MKSLKSRNFGMQNLEIKMKEEYEKKKDHRKNKKQQTDDSVE